MDLFLKKNIFHHISADKLFPSTNIAPMKSTNQKRTLFHCKTLLREVRGQHHGDVVLRFCSLLFRGRIPTKQTTNQPTKQTNSTLPWGKKTEQFGFSPFNSLTSLHRSVQGRVVGDNVRQRPWVTRNQGEASWWYSMAVVLALPKKKMYWIWKVLFSIGCNNVV